MQEGHDWFKTLSSTYKKLKYRQSQAELKIRTQQDRKNSTIAYIYIDNTIGELSDLGKVKRAKNELEAKYKVKTIKKIDYILGIKVKKIEKGIKISQKTYTA